ncbi:MAG TPA: hypothetical protein VLE73_02015 [Candidatus Saccharimonadales bacterium]|nr:hypothetical protein [Candidatus Saccharimonadales bacterium]
MVELPPPSIQLEHTKPTDLLKQDLTLEFFASSPRRLGPFTTLLRRPGKSFRTIEVSTELIEAAQPPLSLSDAEVAHIHYRIDKTLDPTRNSRDAKLYTRGSHARLAYSDAGRRAMPQAALLAAHWLLDPDASNRIVPESFTRPRNYDTRLALLQYALDGIKPYKAANNLRASGTPLSTVMAGRNFEEFLRLGLVHRAIEHGGYMYTVTAELKPKVASLLTSVHNLRDPAYANALRTETLPKIAKKPELYGRIAHGAIKSILNTRHA